MDPLCHTLTGAALGEAGLTRGSSLAAATLLIAANLPDLDAVTYLSSTDLSLGFRRGWSHGVLAMLVLPWLLAVCMQQLGRLDRYTVSRSTRTLSFLRLLTLSYIGVVSHPALDWLNPYGVRLLMPFSSHWFYGNALFILDPVMWLLLGGPVFWVRRRDAEPRMRERIVQVSLALTCAYAIAMTVESRIVERRARHWLATQGTTAIEVAALPVLVNPFVRDVVVLEPAAYEFLIFDGLSSPSFTKTTLRVARSEPDAIVSAALNAPRVQGLREWLRFPTYQVERLPDGYRVGIRDVRFARLPAGGFGSAVVRLDKNLSPVADR